jgi:hypothetical protein
MGTVRRVCRNVKYWRSPSMSLRWAGAAMQGSRQWLQAAQGPQAASDPASGARRAQGKSRSIERESCPNHESCVGCQLAALASRLSTLSRTSPCGNHPLAATVNVMSYLLDRGARLLRVNPAKHLIFLNVFGAGNELLASIVVAYLWPKISASCLARRRREARI